jgi:hypothetical protein
MRTTMHRPATLATLVALLAGTVASPGRAVATDDYLAGYVTAIVERELEQPDARVSVTDGHVTVEAPNLAGADREALATRLGEVPGVVSVRFADDGEIASATPVPPLAAGDEGIVVLPRRELFQPLLADPRWPHFSASWQRYLSDDELRSVGSANFGETFALLEGAAPSGGRWQAGIQAGVFSIFDLEAESLDLVNADYLVALFGSYRRGRFSALGRFLHQSSHLGDEFLLRDRAADRVNLSYEAIDALLSFDVTSYLRVYGGGGGLVHRSPSSLDPFFAQGGAELVSPWTLLRGHVRPLAAVDVQTRQESDWNPDLSVRAGVQLESERIAGPRVQLLAEYYDGRSPNGQFFDRDIEYVGGGLHLHF